MAVDERRRGTWREPDGQPVVFAVAKEAWVGAAREVLIETARRYHAYETHSAVADQAQLRSGVRTMSPMRHGIGEILGRVSDECQRRGEPPLSALCVHADETVGPGYAYVVELAGEPVPKDLDQHAAHARLECYRFFGADLPADGGRPALPPRIAAARARRAKTDPPTPTLCTTCFTVLPTSGQCDNCA